MSAHCKARCRVPAAFGGGSGEVICDLPMIHQCGMHYDGERRLWWLPALLAESRPDVRQADLEAALWHLLARHAVTVLDAVPFMDELLGMVTAYAAGDGADLIRQRIAILRESLGPPSLVRERRP